MSQSSAATSKGDPSIPISKRTSHEAEKEGAGREAAKGMRTSREAEERVRAAKRKKG